VACEQDHSSKHAFGSVADGASFRDVWNSPRAAEVRRIIRDEAHKSSFCVNCPYADRATTDVSIAARQLVPDHCWPGIAASQPVV
jgi:hypothetical protein